MKRIIALFLVVFMILSLCACGNQEKTNSKASKDETSSSENIPTTCAVFSTIADVRYKIIRNGKILDERNVKTEDFADKKSKDFPEDSIIEIIPDNKTTTNSKTWISIHTSGFKMYYDSKDFKKMVIDLAKKNISVDANGEEVELTIFPGPEDGLGITNRSISEIFVSGKGQMSFQTTGDGKTFKLSQNDNNKMLFDAMIGTGMYAESIYQTSTDKEFEIVITDFDEAKHTYTKIS